MLFPSRRWSRRSVAFVISAVCMAATSLALAQVDNARAVRIVVPAPPGGSLDAGARVLAQRLTAITGETHVVENKPGANTLIGSEYVVRAQPDGRTMLYAGVGLITTSLLQKISFSPLEDLRPVIGVANEHYALIATTQLPANAARDLAAAAAGRRGGLNCAAPPGPMALACEQLKPRLNGALTTVPFAGIAPALNAIAGGHVDVSFVPIETAAKLIDSKAAKVLAVSRQPASAGAPGAGSPVLTDIWPGFALEAVQGIYVPARTPDARVRQLNAQLAQVISEPDSITRMQAIGQAPRKADTPENFARLMDSLLLQYGQVVKSLGLGTP